MFQYARLAQPSFALPSAHQIKKRPEARDEGEVVDETAYDFCVQSVKIVHVGADYRNRTDVASLEG